MYKSSLCDKWPSGYYDPRKEIGVLQYPWTDGVSEKYNRPNQIATSVVQRWVFYLL